MLAVADASATAPRTFVASTGNDANPCSLVLPCRTFAAAVAQTASAGEVIPLDSAGYGPVTITQSVSIIAPGGVYAGVTATAGNGITVDGAGINVTLRGLTVKGLGAGASGVYFESGAGLYVDNCDISGFADRGIKIVASGGVVHVTDTSVRANYMGVLIAGGDVASAIYATISRSRVEDNTIDGIGVWGAAQVAIEDSVVTGSSHNVVGGGNTVLSNVRIGIARSLVSRGGCGLCVSTPRDGGAVRVVVMDSTISANLANGIEVGYGFAATGCTLETIVTRTQVAHNGGGLLVDGSVCASQVWLDGATVFENSGGVGVTPRSWCRTTASSTLARTARLPISPPQVAEP
jgi:hypothetical protein